MSFLAGVFGGILDFVAGTLNAAAGSVTPAYLARLRERIATWTAAGLRRVTKDPGVTVRFNFDGSQVVVEQIADGARADEGCYRAMGASLVGRVDPPVSMERKLGCDSQRLRVRGRRCDANRLRRRAVIRAAVSRMHLHRL